MSETFTFLDRKLPSLGKFEENNVHSKSYFIDLHEYVKSFNVCNYMGARVPLSHNNINIERFRFYLTKFEYKNIHVLQFLEFGFPLGLWTDAYLEPSSKNHSSAYSYHSYIDKFVSKELKNTGLSGPFNSAPFNDFMISPLMTSHKKPNGRRAVFDASFGMFSLNKNTPQKAYHEMEYEFTFPRIDDLADIVAKLGRGCFLFKRDLSRYFLQLKVDPIEYDKLGFVWRGQIFFFVSFVWGCRHAGYCGQWVSTAIAFIHAKLGIDLTQEQFNVLNYADDFAGAKLLKEKAELSFNTLGKLLNELGFDESTDKASPPSTVMTYLGVKFDTEKMCLFVDDDKLIELKTLLQKWLNKTVAKKYELQSVLGKLIWVSKTVRFSRVFVARIISEIRKLPSQSAKTTLSSEIRKDFLWWNTFMSDFSGVELIPPTYVSQSVLGDAYPQGGGSCNPVKSQYFSMRFPEYMCSPDTPIHIKEFIVVILAVKMWGKSWTGNRVLIYCDNDSVCDTCQYQKPTDPSMQKLLREFLYWVCHYNFHPILQKVASKDNHIADFISRNHDEKAIEAYFLDNGYLSQHKVHVPNEWFSFVSEW